MTYYATPRDEWPTRAEAEQEPPTSPCLDEAGRDALTRLLVALQEIARGAA